MVIIIELSRANVQCLDNFVKDGAIFLKNRYNSQ